MSSLVAAEQIKVAFAGDGAGTDEMSWGQWEIWLAMTAQHSSLPIGGSTPLAPGTTVEDVADELRYLMSRYQTLRTRLTFAPTGRPRQVVFGSGEITLQVFDGDADPEATAAALKDEFTGRLFDYVNEWPVRMAVVRQHGVPVHLVAIMCHLTMDGLGGMIMLEEVAKRPTEPVDGMQPLEQARWQRSPAGQRQHALAMRHWAQLLRTVPLGQLDDGTDPRQPRYWEGQLHSSALPRAVRAIGDRTQVDSSAILMAIYAIALARVAGINPVFTRPVVSNRFRPRLSNVVCMLAQAGLCVIDVADLTVDEAISRAQHSAMTAYKYAYFDPESLGTLIDEIAAERGPGFSVGCYFNDRRMASRSDTDAPPTPEELAKLAAESTFVWAKTQETPFDALFLHLDDLPGLVQVTVAFDTHRVSPGRAEAVVKEMEQIALAAAFDPNLPTGVAK